MFAVSPDQQGRRRRASDAGRGGAPWPRTSGELGTSCSMSVIEQRVELIEWYRPARLRRPPASERPFPYGDERFGRPRRDDLRFVVLAKPLVGDGTPTGRRTVDPRTVRRLRP